ncbi:hypothetical protein NDU88_003273 [Pleurodeles waltl]|uniref:Uncharacterized protein n=1 Tax=Pleurodeles waltl TaxID=8319 RepID=A0AAV7Q9B4_PLEWA|nr:hypothetical protein NDU88_003273 [Pleurodeles waltl]
MPHLQGGRSLQVSQLPRRAPGDHRCYSSVLGCRAVRHSPLPGRPRSSVLALSHWRIMPPRVLTRRVRGRPGPAGPPVWFLESSLQQSPAVLHRVLVCPPCIRRPLVSFPDFGLVGPPSSPYLPGQHMSAMAAAPGRSTPPPASIWHVRRPASVPLGSAPPLLFPVSGYSAGYSRSRCSRMLRRPLRPRPVGPPSALTHSGATLLCLAHDSLAVRTAPALPRRTEPPAPVPSRPAPPLESLAPAEG